jgi:uncharacterized phage protein gp47/JayE
MPTTNVPPITFTPTGLVLPNESAILAGELADMNTAFGGGMSTSLSSPQGQLAQSLSAIVGAKNDEIALVVNQVDPDTASGRFQDAIGRIYFLDRIAASGTVVTGTCTGLVGTVIPIDSIVQDANGYRYASTSEAAIPATGTVDIDFQCLTTGPIACPTGTLTTIYKSVTGWDSVTNAAAGTPGVDVESRADFEFRRRNSVAGNAVNSPQAIKARVLSVDGVLDAYVIDNPLGTAVDVGPTDFSVAAHSVYVAVAGGEAADIAAAIWNKKSLGCNYNGDTSFTVYDTNGYEQPYPAYLVKWQTPTALPAYFAVQIANNAALPADIATLIKQAIVNAFNGADGGSRARIGAVLYAGRFYAGVAATDPNVEILSILLGDTSPGAGTSLAVGIDQRPTLDPTDITVTLV